MKPESAADLLALARQAVPAAAPAGQPVPAAAPADAAGHGDEVEDGEQAAAKRAATAAGGEDAEPAAKKPNKLVDPVEWFERNKHLVADLPKDLFAQHLQSKLGFVFFPRRPTFTWNLF